MSLIDKNFDLEFPFITEIDNNTWYFQHTEGSIMDSFYIHILPNNRGVVMYGDYGFCYLEPSGYCPNILGWLAGCTCIQYFAEKVSIATENKLEIDEFNSRKFIEDLAKYYKDDYSIDDDEFREIMDEAAEIDNKYEAAKFLYEHDIEDYSIGIDYSWRFKLHHKCMTWAAKKINGDKKE